MNLRTDGEGIKQARHASRHANPTRMRRHASGGWHEFGGRASSGSRDASGKWHPWCIRAAGAGRLQTDGGRSTSGRTRAISGQEPGWHHGISAQRASGGSFVAQGFNGVDRGRLPRGEEAGHQADEGEDARCQQHRGGGEDRLAEELHRPLLRRDEPDAGDDGP